MKYSGHGGYLLIDSVQVGNVTSWDINESIGRVLKTGSTSVSGSISYFFDDTDSNHRHTMGSEVDIDLVVRSGASTLSITDCRITSLSTTGAVNQLNTATLSFESDNAIT